MKRKNHLLISVLLSLVMLFSLIVPAVTAESEPCSGPKVDPVTVSGNPEFEGEHKKIDPPTSGSFTIDNTYTVTYNIYGDGKKLSWNVSPAALIITGVIVKGGPGANIYTYSGGASGDCDLVSPLNRGGNIPRISHFSFTWDVPEIITGSLSGYKYEGEEVENTNKPIEGWKIYLYEKALGSGQKPGDETDDNPYISTTTASDGAFSFTNLALGTYYLYEEIRDGWEQIVVAGPGITLTADNSNSTDNIFRNKETETGGNEPGTETGSISGYKYEGEEVENTNKPIEGWKIYLYEEALEIGQKPGDETDDNPYISTTTASDGAFSFTNLALGTYYLYEEIRDGWEQIVVAGPGITLTADNSNSTDNIFRNKETETGGNEPGTETGSISGYKFHDQNNDGYDNGEPCLAGWIINLYQLTGSMLPRTLNGNGSSSSFTLRNSTTTDEDGTFLFEGLEKGTYRLVEEITTEQISDGWGQTTPNDPDYHEVVINENDESLEYGPFAFGNYRETPGNGGGGDDDDDSGSASLNVFKFNDANKNGIWDAGEEEIKGWKIFVNGKEYSTPVRITVDPANYTVEEEADKDWEACTDTSFSFTLNDGDTKTIHFGNCPVDVEKEYPPDDPSTPPEDPEEEPEVKKDIPPDKPSTPPEEPKDEPEEERIIPPEPPAQTSPPRPELPRTGSNSLLITGLGVLLSAAGIFLKRRKR